LGARARAPGGALEGLVAQRAFLERAGELRDRAARARRGRPEPDLQVQRLVAPLQKVKVRVGGAQMPVGLRRLELVDAEFRDPLVRPADHRISAERRSQDENPRAKCQTSHVHSPFAAAPLVLKSGIVGPYGGRVLPKT